MAIEYYSSIDLNKNELQNAVVQNLGSAPGSPVEGQIYYDTGDDTIYFRNGSAWVSIGGDITGVTAGDGLTGGGTTGAVTLNVVGGDGITANANDVAITAAQTTITSVLNTSLVVGRDADNQVKFGTDNQIIFRVGAGDNVIFKASGEIEATSLDISGDADIDGTLEADAITVGGTALNTVIAGVTVTNATNAAHVLITDNENADEENQITFIEGAAGGTANRGLEADGDFTYNPSSGTVTATIFKGNIDAVDGDFDGTLEADALTIGGTNILTGGIVTTLGTISQDTVLFTSANADDPVVQIKNTTNSAGSQARMEFIKDKGAAGAQLDDIGSVKFIADNDAQQLTDYAEIFVEIGASGGAADGDEAGTMSLKVATSDGTTSGLRTGLFLEGSTGENTVNVSIGNGADSTVTIPGNLVVTGDTTTNNVTTVTTSNGVIFEGTTADGHDATLKSVVAGSDKTYTLPNVTGYVALFAADPSTTAISSTPTELNLLDAGTGGSSVTLATNDTIIIGDTSASNATKKVLMSDVLSLMGSNLTEVGALNAGSITSGFGNIDNGTSGIRTNTFTVETSVVPAAANSATIGTASAEFGDFFLGDGGTIQFGNDQDIIITHEADKGLKISNENTGAAKPMILTLESEEDAIISDDVIAGIEFKAGDSDGTDGATVAAGIFAVASDTFGATSNRTSLVFTTGSSETAGQTSGSLDGVTRDMVLDLFGKLTLQDDLVIGDGKTIGIASDADLMTLTSGVLTIAGELDASSLDISGNADIDGTLETDALTIGGTSILAVATASAQGAVELATAAEVQTGTDTSRVVTPDTLAAKSVVADIDVSSLTDANIVTITHNLGTADIMVQVYDKTTEANIMCDIARTTDDFSTASTSVVSIDFGTAPPNDCRALITSLKGATASGTVAYT